MKYELDISDDALSQIAYFKKSDKQSFKKIEKLLVELADHPFMGTGHPEELKGDYSGYCSRKVNKKDRLIYKVQEEEVIVFVLSTKGHYND